MSEQPAGWGQKELRQLFEDRIGTVLPPNDAARATELAMTIFQYVDTGADIIETTPLDSVERTAMRQRYVTARAYYGPVELLRRKRDDDEWEKVET